MSSWQILMLTILGLSVVMFFRENDLVGKGLCAIMAACLLIMYYLQSRKEKEE